MKIIINGREEDTPVETLSFEDVSFAANSDATPTIVYRRGPTENAEGTLLPGQSVKIKDGMIFNAVDTSRA